MSRFARHLLSRPLLFGILLAALVLRALVPAGYMPAVGQAFAIEICRVGLPSSVAADESAQKTDSHQTTDASFCSFAAAPGAGPAPEVLAVWIPPAAAQPPAEESDVSVVFTRPSHDRQARAPPALS